MKGKQLSLAFYMLPIQVILRLNAYRMDHLSLLQWMYLQTSYTLLLNITRK